MKIVVATIGSRGDVQPYINLCQGLQETGQDIVLATNPTLCPLASAHGVRCAPVGSPVDMGLEGARLTAQSFNNMWIGMIRVMQLGGRLVEEAYPDVLEVCREADLVITSDTGSGIAEAEKLGLPWISVTLQPARLPVIGVKPSFVSRLIWPLIGKLFVAPTNRFRKRVGAPLVKDISSMMSSRMILLPVSRHVAPPNPHWPKYVQPTGYWFPRPQKGWAPSQDLLDFLDRGEKPVAVSLGVMSMTGKQAREGARIVLQAISQSGVRAVIQGWDEALQGVALPSQVYHAGSLPHNWLFDQVAAVVHHGGFGTTAAALRAGVPEVVIPHAIDQFYWGGRVYELGAGPKPISRGRLDAAQLSEALINCKDNPFIRQNAARIGQDIRSEEDGVSAAVRAIENVL